MLLTPDGEYAWKGVLAPHDGFSGLVTGHRYPLQSAKKELEKLSEGRFTPHVPHPVEGSDTQPKRFSAVKSDSKLFDSEELSLPSEGRPLPSYPHIPEEIASKEGTLPGRLTTVEDKETLFKDSTIPEDSALRKGLLPLFAGGAGAAAMALGEAQAAIPADQYRFPADEPGWVNPEPPLETPLVSPVDLVLAPAGVAKASGKVAAVAAEPFVAWGMDKAVDWLGEAAAPALRQAAGGFVEAAAPGIAQSWGWMGNAAGGLLEHFQQEDD